MNPKMLAAPTSKLTPAEPSEDNFIKTQIKRLEQEKAQLEALRNRPVRHFRYVSGYDPHKTRGEPQISDDEYNQCKEAF